MISEALNPPEPQSDDGNLYLPRFNGSWSLTECIGCPAALLHRAAGCPRPPIGAHTRSLFYEGLLHEQDVKNRMDAAGIHVVEFNIPIIHRGLPIFGHPDGLLDDPRMIEIKTIAQEEDVDDLLDNHKKYEPQVHGYMAPDMLNVNKAVIIPKVRANGWILDDVEITYDDAVASVIWRKVEAAANIVATRSPVPCPTVEPYLDCSRDYLTRLQCPYYNHCTRDPDMASQHLHDTLLEYAAVKVVKDMVEGQFDAFRASIAEVMTLESKKQFKTQEGINVSYFEQSRSRVNRKLLEEKYPLVAKEVIEESGGAILRVTIPKALQKSLQEEASKVTL